MRNALKYLTIPFLCIFCLQVGAQEGSFVRQLQPRDSILIGDQLEYGVKLENVEAGIALGFPEFEDFPLDLIEKKWTRKVLATRNQGDSLPELQDIEATVRVAAFEEGSYTLPSIAVARETLDGKIDTLFFDPIEIEVKTMPVDTATFKVHPMIGLVETPFTWEEFVFTVKEVLAAFLKLLPVLIICKWAIMIIIAGVCIWIIWDRKGRNSESAKSSEPAHIVALRKLDAYRSNAMWVPEKQKEFYTGVTDALREYMSRRYGIAAMEMTSAELFNEIQHVEEFPGEFFDQLKSLFETADYVKFAKFVASDEENASAVPMAVRFVTQTYQSELERQQAQTAEVQEEKKK